MTPKGLLAAVGAWADHAGLEQLVDEIILASGEGAELSGRAGGARVIVGGGGELVVRGPRVLSSEW